MRKLVAALVCAAVVSVTVQAQDYNDQAKAIMERAELKRAFDYIDAHRDDILSEWKTITEINAPSGKEQPRAAFVKRLLETYKLDRVYSDTIGNVIAVRKGAGTDKPVIFDAHLDTVFQEGLKIKAEIREGKIYAPGVGDDTRNVEALLAVIRAMNEAGVKTRSDLIFVFTVAEETSFGGAKHFIQENKARIGQYVALDGGY